MRKELSHVPTQLVFIIFPWELLIPRTEIPGNNLFSGAIRF